MPAVTISNFAHRLTRVRAAFAPAQIDALLVSHLANIRYLTGFAGTSGALLVSQNRATLCVDGRYSTAARTLDAATAGLFDVVVSEREADEAAEQVIRNGASRRVGIEAAYLSVSRFNRLTGTIDDREVVATERIVEAVRAVKDASEIATLREAARRLSLVARDLHRFVLPGRAERDVAADLDAAMRAAGFERPAFETIVASGPNSALPHARPTTRTLEVGEGVVLDFGGIYDGYCVDLTRTLHFGPRPPALRRLFAAVAEAHAAAVAAVRPGIPASEIDRAARDVLGRHRLAEAFGHGTGHGLGLEIHEEPRLSEAGTARHDAIVEPGMVFTIEPGAYVPGVGGVRLEDDVLAGESGAEVLTDVPIDQ